MYRNKKEILFYCLLSVIMKNSSGSESVQCGKNVCRGQKVCLLNVKMKIMLVERQQVLVTVGRDEDSQIGGSWGVLGREGCRARAPWC